MNARFWVWWNHGFVKITLRDGEHTEDEPFALFRGGPCDEGWSSLTELYWLDGGSVCCETIDDGRDCDGRLTDTRRFYCRPTNLKVNAPGEYTPDPDVMLPQWKPAGGRSHQIYDESAQAMGY